MHSVISLRARRDLPRCLAVCLLLADAPVAVGQYPIGPRAREAFPHQRPTAASGAVSASPGPAVLDGLLAEAERLGRLTSLLAAQGGELVLERYFHGLGPGETVNLKSVSKTLLSPLVGIALRDGLLVGVEQRLADLLPDYYQRLTDTGLVEGGKADLTLHHLLSMRSGLETTSFQNYGAWVASSDWAWDQLRRPLVCRPGRCHHYSTGNTHLLSVILERRSGKSLREYARESFFAPLGIALPEWDRDPQGHYLGGNNMSLRPRDLLKIGQLYLDGGRLNGRQLVPEWWIEASWQTNGRSPWNGYGYGYLWWMDSWSGERVYFAWGYGGQYLVLVPRLDLAIVITSGLRPRERGYTRRLRRFLARSVIPAFAVPAPGSVSRALPQADPDSERVTRSTALHPLSR